MTHLYSIKDHPTTMRPIIRVWEIVHSTNTFYDLQARNIPNKDAMKVTRRVSKAQVEHLLSHRNEYHFSPQAAMNAFIRKHKLIIKYAEDEIEMAQSNILLAVEDLPAQIAKLVLDT